MRSLSGLIAHEVTHNLIRDHLGQWRSFWLPEWKNEGYAEYVSMHGQEEFEHSLVAGLPPEVSPNGMSERYRRHLERVLQALENQPSAFSTLLEFKESDTSGKTGGLKM